MLFLLTSSILFGQVDDNTIRQIVLKNNSTDSLYVFGKWNKDGKTETHLNYLGILIGNTKKYKIMTSSRFWGMSKRATNTILVYTIDNKYIGEYYMTMTYDLPEKIDNNQIVFSYSKNNDCNKSSRLSFTKGIPNEFFIECKNGFGNFYSFYSEK